MTQSTKLRVWMAPALQLVAAVACITTIGCDQGKPPTVSVDADTVATRAMELCDVNKDGGVTKDEAAASCPPLAAAFTSFDSDADGKATQAEMSARIAALANSTKNMTGIGCTVLLDHQPLVGALVKLRPAAMYGDIIPPAEGTTDELGTARPSIGDAHLPEKLKGAALLYPGLYAVEVTHPTKSLPSRYNAKTQLGCEVDPLSRSGVAPHFDLTSK
jgi:hypothetical protein